MAKLARNLLATMALLGLVCVAAPAWSADSYGKLNGVVIDPSGTPQMGATVWLSAEMANGRAPTQLLSDQEGIFASDRLRPGLYAVRVTLAGFLPTIQQHIRITANLTTLVHIELDSVFASLDQMRRRPGQSSESDDWKWVLRTAGSSRPILQLTDGTIVIADNGSSGGAINVDDRQPRGQLQMTNGSSYPGSPSALPGRLTTAVSYDQKLGTAGRLLLAGQMSYDGVAGDPAGAVDGGLASIWLPSGQYGHGPQTTVVMRQMRFGPQNQTARLMRVEQSEQFVFSDRVRLDYGGEYAGGGVRGTMNSSVRPRGQLGMRLSPNWTAALIVETDPGSYSLRSRTEPLDSSIDALSTLPILVWKNGRSALADGWHEEVSVKRSLGTGASVEAASFYDYSDHQAVFGFLSGMAYAQDAGPGGSMGTRIVYRQKINSNLELSALYVYAGALAPGEVVSNGASGAASNLVQPLDTRYRHGAAGRVSGKVPRTGTSFTASYKWLSGIAVSRQDLYGEAALGIDPYLSLTVRQPLPGFGASGRWEALVDVRNLLAQGYVPSVSELRGMVLAPVERSFRGGVSFQF